MFQKENTLPFMALNKVSDMSAADWLSQTHMKSYRKFLRVEIPIKHSRWYNK